MPPWTELNWLWLLPTVLSRKKNKNLDSTINWGWTEAGKQTKNHLWQHDKLCRTMSRLRCIILAYSSITGKQNKALWQQGILCWDLLGFTRAVCHCGDQDDNIIYKAQNRVLRDYSKHALTTHARTRARAHTHTHTHTTHARTHAHSPPPHTHTHIHTQSNKTQWIEL